MRRFIERLMILLLLVSVITSLGTVMLPRAAYYVHRGRMEDFQSMSRKALRFVFLAAAPCMVFFFLFARPTIGLLSGPDFLPAVRPMRVLMPTVLLIGVTNILGIEIMVPTDRERYVLYSVVAGALIDLILNAVLIPIYSATGAAVSTLIAEAAVLLIQLWFLRREARNVFAGISYGKILLSLLPAALISFWLIRVSWSDFTTLLLAAPLFFGAIGMTVAGWILAVKDENADKPVMDAEIVRNLTVSRVKTPSEAMLEEQKKQKQLALTGWGLFALCMVPIAIYVLNGKHFPDGNLEEMIAALAIHVFPWIILGLGCLCISTILQEKSIQRETAAAQEQLKAEKAAAGKPKAATADAEAANSKAAVKTAPADAPEADSRPDAAEVKTDSKPEATGAEAGSEPVKKAAAPAKKPDAKRRLQLIVAIAAVVFIILGVMNGSAKAVYTKAANICTECVGLG